MAYVPGSSQLRVPTAVHGVSGCTCLVWLKCVFARLPHTTSTELREAGAGPGASGEPEDLAPSRAQKEGLQHRLGLCTSKEYW